MRVFISGEQRPHNSMNTDLRKIETPENIEKNIFINKLAYLHA